MDERTGVGEDGDVAEMDRAEGSGLEEDHIAGRGLGRILGREISMKLSEEFGGWGEFNWR